MFWFAVAFLTRLPVPESAHHVDAATRARAAIWFPAVGALVGLLTAAVTLGLARFLPFPIALLIGLAFEARATGAMHEDALADAGDALGGGWDREAVLRILKDSRLGTYGTLALVLGVALRYAAMLHVPREDFLAICVLAAAAGRWTMLWLIRALPPIPGRASLSGDVGVALGGAQVWLSALALLAAAVVALPEHLALAVVAALATAAFLLWYRAYLRRRLGGSTGDLLGAAAFVGQLIVLVAYCVRT